MPDAHRIYHWKHGWIPLDHTAALSKAKGNEHSARQYLAASHATGHAHKSVVGGSFAGGTHVRGLQPVAGEHLPRDRHIIAAFDPQTRRFSLLDQSPNHGGVSIPEHLAEHLNGNGFRIKNVTDRPGGKKVTAAKPDGTLVHFSADGSDIHEVDRQVIDTPPLAPPTKAPAFSEHAATHTVRPSSSGRYSVVQPVGGRSIDLVDRKLGDHITAKNEKIIGHAKGRTVTTVDTAGVARRYKVDGSNIDSPVLVRTTTSANFKRKDLAGFQHVPAHEAIPDDGSTGGNIAALKVKRAYVKGNKRVLIESTISDAQAETFLKHVGTALDLTKDDTGEHPLTIHVPSGHSSFRVNRRRGTTLGFVYGGESSRVHVNPSLLLEDRFGTASSGHHMEVSDNSPKVLYTLVHELGHTVDHRNMHTRENSSFTAGGKVHTHSVEKVSEGEFHREHATELSNYGRRMTQEGYAEAFAQHHLSKKNPHDPNSRNSRAARAYAKRYGWSASSSDETATAFAERYGWQS